MRYLWLVVPLWLSSCTSIRYVTVEKGHLVTDAHAPVNIIGNPPVDCSYPGSSDVFSGYFMYVADNGTIFLDNYGRNIIRLHGDVICTLKHED
jgi:hypothetical protein